MLPVFSRNHFAVMSSGLRLDEQTADAPVNSAPQIADDELLRRYSENGSEEAFSQIVYRHAGWVYHLCRRRLNDAHLAEDATQAVFLLLARKTPTMPPPAHLAGWLFQACRYVLAETRRNDKRYRHRQDIARDVMLQRISTATAAEAAPDPHLSAALDDALVRLRASERQTILMHFYEGLTLRQMADQLGISKEGAKKRVNRALSHLRRGLEGKIHRINRRPNVAGLAVIFWLLQNRRSEAAPTGLAETVAKSATVPGVSSSMAELMAHGVVNSIARARHKLLATLLLLILELVLIVPIAILRGRGQHNAMQIASAPTSTAPAQVQSASSTNSPSQLSTATQRDPGTWLDPNAPSPPPRPYAPADDDEPSPQKSPPMKSNQPTKDSALIALAQPPAQGGPLADSAQSIANAVKVTLPSTIASASGQSNILTAAPSVVQFSEIKLAVTRKSHTLANPIIIEHQENCPQPGSRPPTDDFKFPSPPPPGDRPPFDPFDKSPHHQATFAFADGDLRDLPDPPHHGNAFPMQHFEPFVLLDLPPRDPDLRAILKMPSEFALDHHFPSMLIHPAYAALSDSIAFLDDGSFPPPEHLLANFDAGFGDSHFLFMSPVPEPASLLLLLISATTLSLRPTRKRPDAN